MYLIENNSLRVEFCAKDGLIVLHKASGETVTQNNCDYHISEIFQEEERICYQINSSGISCGVELFFAGPNELVMRLSADQDAEFTGNLAYPPAWKMRQDDTGIYPIGGGYAFPVNDLSLNIQECMPFYSGSSASLNLVGLLRNELCVITGLASGCDAELHNSRDKNDLLFSQIQWIGQKDKWGYNREVNMFFAHGLVESMQLYRKWREKMGWLVTLEEKAEVTPCLRQFPGCADVWVWDENNMNRLYGRPEEPGLPERDVRKIADEMKAMGMNRILWNSFEGETRADCDYLKSKGFIVGKYDVYRDVLPKDMVDYIIPYRVKRSVNTKYWPEIVSRQKDGSYKEAWSLHGLDGKMHCQHSVCDICALELTQRNVPSDIDKIGYNSRFIDVQAASALGECYDPKHPTTRTDSAEYILHQQKYLAELGLINGVEVGAEIFASGYHFSEGMTSPGKYRVEDSGRHMTTLYYGDNIPESITEYMLNPRWRIPLWELVYHDCVVSYNYWGDSTNSCPELMALRDMFCALYGLPPIYSIDVSSWEKLKHEIAESYHRATKTAKLTAFSAMTTFEYLTPDKLVQRTGFANGVRVTANFSDKEYVNENREIILPLRYLMDI